MSLKLCETCGWVAGGCEHVKADTPTPPARVLTPEVWVSILANSEGFAVRQRLMEHDEALRLALSTETRRREQAEAERDEAITALAEEGRKRGQAESERDRLQREVERLREEHVRCPLCVAGWSKTESPDV